MLAFGAVALEDVVGMDLSQFGKAFLGIRAPFGSIRERLLLWLSVAA